MDPYTNMLKFKSNYFLPKKNWFSWKLEGMNPLIIGESTNIDVQVYNDIQKVLDEEKKKQVKET